MKYLLIGVSVSLDELAVGTIKGVQVKHMRRVDPWITGLYFAVFQGVMLIIGFYGASLFFKGSSAVTEWIADGLLMLIGANMVREAFSKSGDDAKQQDLLAKMDVKSMSVLSLTMSLDALAVGVSLALGHRLDIWWASLSAAAATQGRCQGRRVWWRNPDSARPLRTAAVLQGVLTVLVKCAPLFQYQLSKTLIST